MLDCVKCLELERELEKAALEYWRATLLKELEDLPNTAAKEKMLTVQKRFNDHKLTHEVMPKSATK